MTTEVATASVAKSSKEAKWRCRPILSDRNRANVRRRRKGQHNVFDDDCSAWGRIVRLHLKLISLFRGAGAYTADTTNAVPLFWLVRHTMHFAVPLFRPSNNNFRINLILGAVSRRNEIMFTVSLFWHYLQLQNNIVQRIFKMIRFTSNKSNFYLHQQRSVALKYA